MSNPTIHVHGATAIRVGPIRHSPKGFTWRDVTVETAEGSFCITAFSDEGDALVPIIESEEQREAG